MARPGSGAVRPAPLPGLFSLSISFSLSWVSFVNNLLIIFIFIFGFVDDCVRTQYGVRLLPTNTVMRFLPSLSTLHFPYPDIQSLYMRVPTSQSRKRGHQLQPSQAANYCVSSFCLPYSTSNSQQIRSMCYCHGLLL